MTTDEELIQLHTQWPTLRPRGLGEDKMPSVPFKSAEDRAQVDIARYAVKDLKKLSVAKYPYGSYGLKHEVEKEYRTYLSNGSLIAAALLEGFTIKQPTDERYLPSWNCGFNFTYRPHERIAGSGSEPASVRVLDLAGLPPRRRKRDQQKRSRPAGLCKYMWKRDYDYDHFWDGDCASCRHQDKGHKSKRPRRCPDYELVTFF